MGHFSEAELLERGEADGRCAIARSDDALPRRVVLVAFPNAQILDITGPMEILRGASVALQQFGSGVIGPAYQVEVVAHRAGPLRTSCGLEILATGAFATCRDPIDTLMVAGGIVTEALKDRSLVPFLRNAASRARRVAAVCTGAFLLAEAGLLVGRRAVTHWRQCDRLARLHPDLTVEPDAIFVKDGNVYTSAGVTAAMDLTLALVEEDFGRKVALEVAREKVLFVKRPGGQAQFSAQLVAQAAEHPKIQSLLAWIGEHVASDLTVERMAEQVAMSPRTFARLFKREMGTTPARFLEITRVDQARRLLEDGDERIERIARACGFGDEERMRRAFHRWLRVSPQNYRSRFRPDRSVDRVVNPGPTGLRAA